MTLSQTLPHFLTSSPSVVAAGVVMLTISPPGCLCRRLPPLILQREEMKMSGRWRESPLLLPGQQRCPQDRAASKCRVTEIFMMKMWHDRNSKTIAKTMMCNWAWEGGPGTRA